MTDTNAIWDETHLKALLQLLRSPFHLIQAPPWDGWIQQHGGLKAVYDYLLNLEELTQEQRQLLRVILEHPHQDADLYAVYTNISRKTYFRSLHKLLSVLERSLNRWGLAAALPFAPPSNLPAPLTRLIGREQEINTLSVLMQQSGVRLVTLTGPGGIGKTRLAIQVAANLESLFEHGIFFVALAALQDPALVASTLAKALRINDDGSRPLVESIKQQLRTQNALLVFDNFEQLLEAAPLVSELLTEAPEVKVLVTSRVHLHVYGEHEFVVPPLVLPDAAAAIDVVRQSSAVALFVERAQAANQDFELAEMNKTEVIRICSKLDGLPLAIELTAAHSRSLSPSEILIHLDRRLDFLGDGPRDLPARQRTIRAAIDWSYSLLDAPEQVFFRRSGVFVGGMTTEAAQAVCFDKDEGGNFTLPASSLLKQLADKSLLVTERASTPEDEPRFRFLETIRDYALEQLAASGEQEALQRRHARYYVALVETLEPQSTGSQQSLWFERLEAEHHNLRAVLNWAFERDELELALRVAGAVWKFWQIHGYLSEGYAWLERILTQARAQHSRLRRPEGAQAYLKALWAGGWTAFVYSAFEQAERHFQEGEQLARQVGELRSLGLALHGRGAIARLRGKHDEADALYAESLPLFEQAGDQEHVAWTWHNFGITEWYRGNYAQALPPLERGADLFRALGQRFALAESLRLLGGVARDLGDYSQAMQFYTEGLSIYAELGDERNVALIRANLGTVALAQNDYDQASALFKECLTAARDRDDKWVMLWNMERLAEVAGAQGEVRRAVCLWMAAGTLRDSLGMPPTLAEQLKREQALDAARFQMEPSTFETQYQEARAMNLEQALAYALGVATR